MEYISREDAERRLDSTICMYDGKPVWVNSPINYPAGTIALTELSAKNNNNQTFTTVMDPKFSITPPELGYINFNKKAYYLQRYPDRKQKQGLSSALFAGPGFNALIDEYGDRWLRSSAMEDMLTNNYPSYAKALAFVMKNPGCSMAFHKRACVGDVSNGVIGLYHCNMLVGTISPESGVVRMCASRQVNKVLSQFFINNGVANVEGS